MSERTFGEIAKALTAFQSDMPTIKKSKTADVPTKNGGKYSYTYADLASVSEIAMPLLAEHGLAFSSCPRRHDHGYELTGVLLHSSGEYIEGALPLYGNSPQEIGSALTYARRYLLGCMTGLVTDDDDDAQTAQAKSRRTEPKMTAKSRSEMFALFGQKGVPEDRQLSGINSICGSSYESRGDLSEKHAREVIAALRKRPDADPDPLADVEPPAHTEGA